MESNKVRRDKKREEKVWFTRIVLVVVFCLSGYFIYLSQVNAQEPDFVSEETFKDVKGIEEELIRVEEGLDRYYQEIKGLAVKNKSENKWRDPKEKVVDKWVELQKEIETLRLKIGEVSTGARGKRDEYKVILKRLEALEKESDRLSRLYFKIRRLELRKNFLLATLKEMRKNQGEQLEGGLDPYLYPPENITIAGTYNCSGTNPDGSTYQGRVTLTPSGGNTFKVHWVINDQEWYGEGTLTKGGKLYIRYTGAFSGDGTWILNEDGSFKGTWRASGNPTPGEETWTGHVVKFTQPARKLASPTPEKMDKQVTPEELKKKRKHLRRELREVNNNIKNLNWMMENKFLPEQEELVKKQIDKREDLLRWMRAKNERLYQNPRADASDYDRHIENLKEEIASLESEEQTMRDIIQGVKGKLKTLKVKKELLTRELKKVNDKLGNLRGE